MGSLFGAKLSLAGFDIRLIDVNQAHIDAVNQEGLRLQTEAGAHTVRVPIGPASAFAGPVDLVLVFTKGPQTVAALEAAQHLIGPSTWALTLQNGLGNGDRVAAVVPEGRVLIGMTNWPSDMRGPGLVSSHGLGEVRLWSLDGQSSEALTAAVDILSAAGLNAHADPSVLVSIWEKAAFNAAMNSIAAVTGFTVGEMSDDDDTRALARAVVEEATAVANARGIQASEARVLAMVEHAFADHRPHKPSMLQDVLNHRQTEIGSINGAIVEEASKSRLSVPVIQTLLRLVSAKERHYA
jgi:2-dehydropantoate 2-reductase